MKDPGFRKWMFWGYLVILMAGFVYPFDKSLNLSNIMVLELRLDYLIHGFLFIPLMVLWRLAYPRNPWWMILSACLVLAAGLEGIHFLLSYRSWNINDMIGNITGVFLGAALSGWLQRITKADVIS
jgi:glycopeptide antibiotics resistance protein